MPTTYNCERCSFSVSGDHADEIEAISLAHDSRCTRHSYTPAPPQSDGRFRTVAPDAPEIIEQLASRIRRGAGWWARDASTTVIGALVPVAESFPGYGVEGWPEWLPRVVHELYEAMTGAADEQAVADEWMSGLARLLAAPVDYSLAHARFLSGVLNAARASMLADGFAQQVTALYAQAAETGEVDEVTRHDILERAWTVMDDPGDPGYSARDADDARVAKAACTPWRAEDAAWNSVFACGQLVSGYSPSPDPQFMQTARLRLIEALAASAPPLSDQDGFRNQ